MDPREGGVTLDKLADIAPRMSIHLGSSPLPRGGAGGGRRDGESGIQAIWNFAPVRLKVLPHIIVHNEDLTPH